MAHKDNDEIINLRDKLMRIIAPDTAVPVRKAKAQNVCARCGKDATVFSDKISEREYNITQWCQICQNNFFQTKGEEHECE